MVCAGVGAGAQVSSSMGSNGPNLLTANAPFNAERVTRTSLRLQDGAVMTREEHELIGRDAEGRLFDDSFLAPQTGAKAAHFYLIADPVAKRRTTWNDLGKTGFRDVLSSTTHLEITALQSGGIEESHWFPKTKVEVKTEDLGKKMIAGVQATGTRTTTTLPAGESGNSVALTKTEEVWMADDLQLVVAETDTSSISGTRTVTTVSLKKTAPEASRYEVPQDVSFKSMFGSLAPALGRIQNSN